MTGIVSPPPAGFTATMTPIDALKPHPQNYRNHPDDQLEHLSESIRANGFYRNVVAARDGTILAGHGVVQAAKKMGLEAVPVIRLDIAHDDPRAFKVLLGDNGIGHLAEQDDRALSELLKVVATEDLVGLLGTGYDEAMLAALVFTTRPKSEVPAYDAAAEWAGMPEYSMDDADPVSKIVVGFATDDDRSAFCKLIGLRATEKTKSCWWPVRENDDVSSVRFTT